MQKFVDSLRSGHDIWLGLSCSDDGAYKWQDGSEAEFIDWEEWESENCSTDSAAWLDLGWMEGQMSELHAMVCEEVLVPRTTTTTESPAARVLDQLQQTLSDTEVKLRSIKSRLVRQKKILDGHAKAIAAQTNYMQNFALQMQIALAIVYAIVIALIVFIAYFLYFAIQNFSRLPDKRCEQVSQSKDCV